MAQTEGAKFWLQVLTELQNRGVKDIFIACVDGLKGFPEAIEAVYPRTEVQLCIVHLVRASLHYVPWKLRKAAVADLQAIYRAATANDADSPLARTAEPLHDSLARPDAEPGAVPLPLPIPVEVGSVLIAQLSHPLLKVAFRNSLGQKERWQPSVKEAMTEVGAVGIL